VAFHPSSRGPRPPQNGQSKRQTRLRSQALNIARANGVANIAQALWSGALDPAVTLSYRGL